MQVLNKIMCPKCDKWLMSASPKAMGVVEIYCKRCRTPVRLSLGSKNKPDCKTPTDNCGR